MVVEYCCADFKKAVEGEDNIFKFFEYSQKYEIDSYDIKLDYILNYCPFCGKKL